ncbi:MAG: hypothetical protein KC591_10860, partial [Gemmatimonadetes bacterium]|nr:hypothetical protein [Gemmatimonadota bacterium]
MPSLGVAFEHYGETYAITADQDTVAVIDDLGTVGTLSLRSRGSLANRFRLDGSAQWGNQTARLSLDFDGRWRRGANEFELAQETGWRHFRDSGDYALSSDHLRERARVGWTRDLGERLSLRLRHRFDGIWYATPDPYNLDSISHEPGFELRWRNEDFDEIRGGYRFTRRSVPDSTTLGYDRHTLEAGGVWAFGSAITLDVTDRADRRTYDPGSVRESSWENRADVSLDLDAGALTTFRFRHANEVVRFDAPDDLDFDYEWARTSFVV